MPNSLSFDPDKLELPFHHVVGGERANAAGVLEILRPSDGQYCDARPVAGEENIAHTGFKPMTLELGGKSA